MRPQFVQLISAILLSALLAGCAGTRSRSDVRQYLEEVTGSSVTYVTKPVAFVIEQPGLASSGRDYVYLAPIAVSRGGERSCWLWLGVWSTVDRQARNEHESPLQLGALQILADDEPIDMDSRPALPNPTGIHRLPYTTPVPPTQELLVPVTRSQLQRLGLARVLSLLDRPVGGGTRVWRGDDRVAAVLSDFAEAVGAARVPSAPVTGR